MDGRKIIFEYIMILGLNLSKQVWNDERVNALRAQIAYPNYARVYIWDHFTDYPVMCILFQYFQRTFIIYRVFTNLDRIFNA